MAENKVAPVKAETRVTRRWDPFALFDEMEREMARLWGAPWPIAPRPVRGNAQEPAPWRPSMDIFEQDGNLVVKTALPGVKKGDISVALEAGDLVIRGERKTESEVKEKDYHRQESSYGSFYRRLPLGFEVDAAKVVASYADGVLELKLPLPVEAKPETKQIKVG